MVNCLLCPSGKNYTSCSSGKYFNLSTNDCKDCLFGTFSNSSGAFNCFQCDSGRYSSSGSSTCTPCPIGKYSLNAAAAGCTDCPPGSLSNLMEARTAHNVLLDSIKMH